MICTLVVLIIFGLLILIVTPVLFLSIRQYEWRKNAAILKGTQEP